MFQTPEEQMRKRQAAIFGEGGADPAALPQVAPTPTPTVSSGQMAAPSNPNSGAAAKSAGDLGSSVGMGVAMVNPVAGVAIMAASQLMSGLLGAKAAKKEAERQRKFQATQQGLESQKESYGNLAKNQAGAFQGLTDSFKSALVR